MKMILGSKRHHYVTKASIFLITVALIAGMVGCNGTSPAAEIWDWYDLDAIRDNLGASCLLMCDLHSAADGYGELASETANQGRGWQPIGSQDKPFTGTFDGQGFEVGDLSISRLDTDHVGLFGFVGEKGVIKNVGVVNAYVVGELCVGGLVGIRWGTVSNSYSAGSVSGSSDQVGGLVGYNYGTVSKSCSTGAVAGDSYTGGLVGFNRDTVSDSYSSGNVTGGWLAGGLVGQNRGTISKSYSAGPVTGDVDVGGLVGRNYEGSVSNSFWDTETSGQHTSDGGTGKTTAELQDKVTFSGAMWNMIEVADPDSRNPSYIWNIVDTITYAFLSWQS